MTVRLPMIPDAPSAALPADGRRKRIQPADVRGRFANSRGFVFLLLIGLWAALPWVPVGGHPAVFVDLSTRELFLFGFTFNPQDTWLLFFLMTGVGFGLVYATALAGRVWCGWACPQTVFLDGVYRRIERLIEGPREKRIRRDAGPKTLEWAARKSASHGSFFFVSLLLANIVLAYFVSIPKAVEMIRQSPNAHPEPFFWVLSLAIVLYLNFAWFREQFCVVMCPYGRLQSALIDEHSLVVGYDVARGEPRGKKGAAGAGDCVDCKRCVVVCPTGIDIRNGIQMECIACTACIDACDDIMTKVGRPRGLVRYDSLDGLAGKPRRVWRPRIALYTALLVVGAVVASFAMWKRTDFEATVLRLPGEPYRVEGDEIRNALQVHIVNKRAELSSYRVEVDSSIDMTAVVPLPTVDVTSLGDARVPLFVSVPRSRFVREFPVRIHVVRVGDEKNAKMVTATFLGPGR